MRKLLKTRKKSTKHSEFFLFFIFMQNSYHIRVPGQILPIYKYFDAGWTIFKRFENASKKLANIRTNFFLAQNISYKSNLKSKNDVGDLFHVYLRYERDKCKWEHARSVHFYLLIPLLRCCDYLFYFTNALSLDYLHYWIFTN